MKGYYINIEEKTLGNSNYREVLFTGPHSQLVVMALKPHEDIPEEVHEEHDQFIRVEAGEGLAIIDGEEFKLENGTAIVIPAGAKHYVKNSSESEGLKLYTIYTPPEHPDGTIHRDQPEEK